jgi:hypothetical protein
VLFHTTTGSRCPATGSSHDSTGSGAYFLTGELGRQVPYGGTVWEHNSYQGRSLALGLGGTNWSSLQAARVNDVISSVRLAPGLKAILFADANYLGQSATVGSSQSTLVQVFPAIGAPLADKASSVLVYRPVVSALKKNQLSAFVRKAPIPCELLVIAPDTFAAEAQRLVDHKKRTGMSAHVVRLSEILGSPADPDVSVHPWRIKNLITEAVERCSTRYVMLAGDASLIPTRHRTVWQGDGGSAEGMNCTYNATDLYYSDLYLPGSSATERSDWDASGTGHFAEQIWGVSPAIHNPDCVDGYPRVAVGRVPAHTVAEFGLYVTKVIDYESGNKRPAHSTCALIGDHGLSTNSPTQLEGIVQASGLTARPGHSVRRYVGNANTTQMPSGWTPLTQAQQVADAMSQRWVFHLGHGFHWGWEMHLADGARLDGGWVGSDSATEWRPRDNTVLPIILSGGCETGQMTPNAPMTSVYRGLSPDKSLMFTFDKVRKEVTESASGTPVPMGWPLTTPRPHPYDARIPGRTFAYHWLCQSGAGGAIAYIGAAVGQQDALAVRLLTHVARHLGTGTVLGDCWLAGCRDYHTANLEPDEANGSRRIYLGIMHLFGDPSLRL